MADGFYPQILRKTHFFYGGGQADIALVRNDGTGLTQLTNAPQHASFLPRWSPDGSKIAFYSQRSGSGSDLWTIRPDGSGINQLTETRYRITHFAWSPDGSRIAYSSAEGHTYIFDPESPWEEQSPEKLPSTNQGRFVANSWSPDGQWLAGHLNLDSGARRIALFSIASQEYQVLPVDGRTPVWLRDSRRLLFSQAGKIRLLDRESGNHREVLSLGLTQKLIPQFKCN